MEKITHSGSYVLFVKTTCPFCHMAVNLLESQSLPYKKIVLPENSDMVQQVKNAFDWDTVPMVFSVQEDNSYLLIGGYTDLEALING